jgi:hypothetical protein
VEQLDRQRAIENRSGGGILFAPVFFLLNGDHLDIKGDLSTVRNARRAIQKSIQTSTGFYDCELIKDGDVLEDGDTAAGDIWVKLEKKDIPDFPARRLSSCGLYTYTWRSVSERV